MIRKLQSLSKDAVLGFGVGCLATVLILGGVFTLYSQLILHCAFEWGIFWAAMQALAIIVAAIIALLQFQRYTDIERAKATADVLSMFVVGKLGKAYALLDEGGRPEELAASLLARTNEMAATDNKKDLYKILDATERLQRYFALVTNMLQGKVIDEDLYLGNMLWIILRFYLIVKAAQQTGEQIGEQYVITFVDLARRAQSALKAIKELPPEYEYFKNLEIN